MNNKFKYFLNVIIYYVLARNLLNIENYNILKL